MINTITTPSDAISVALPSISFGSTQGAIIITLGRFNEVKSVHSYEIIDTDSLATIRRQVFVDHSVAVIVCRPSTEAAITAVDKILFNNVQSAVYPLAVVVDYLVVTPEWTYSKGQDTVYATPKS